MDAAGTAIPIGSRDDALELAARIEELFVRREREALEMILRTAVNMRRSLRRAREPKPREGIEGGLLLIELACREALGK